MKYKKSLIFICLIICLFSFASVCASDVNETVVASENQNSDFIEIDNENDDVLAVEEQVNDDVGATEENELSATQGSFTDLYNDIVNANGELNLTRNYVYDSSRDSNYVNGITINKQITINGKGFVINGNDQARAFIVAKSNVTLRNIKFTNCNISDWGGAIQWQGNTGSLYDCNFVNCYSLWSGAVYWKGDAGNLHDCNFVNCYSINSAGAVYWEEKNGSLIKSTFENCHGSLSNSISIGGSSSYSISSYGGAVCWNGDDGNMADSIFRNCYISSALDISFSTTYTGTVTGRSNCNGGAVYWEGKNGNLNNSTFENCYGDSYSYCNSYGYSTSSNTNAYSFCNGGAICWMGDNGNLTNSNFIGCHGSSSSYGFTSRVGSGYSYCYGGALYWNGAEGNLFNCEFRNSYVSSSSYCSEYGSKSSNSYGGAVYWYGDEGNIFSCSFNKFNTYGEISSSGRAIYLKGNNENMFNCSFNGSYYNYREVCNAEKSVCPVLLIHTSDLYNDDRIVICEITPLVNNITASIYDVTDKITLYKQFSISSEDLTLSFTVNDLPEGEYQLVLEYAGDSFYTATSANNLFKIGKNSSQEVTITGELVEGDNVTINVTLNEDATGRVKLTLANYTLINELIDGKTSFYIPYINGGINTYKIKYEGDNKYNPIYITNTIKVLYKSNIKLNLKEDIVFDENIPLTYTLTPKSTGNISVFVDNIFKANITVDEAFELENISVGDHNITVIYSGNEYYSTSKDSATFTVSKANPLINITSSDLAGNVIFEVVLNEKATGNVIIVLNNNSYSQNLTGGKTNITIPDLVADTYNCVINYNGDSNYNPLTRNYEFTLKLKESNINVYVNDIDYGDVLDVHFNLTTDATGTISVYLNNSFVKNSFIGENINISDLAAGNYIVKLIYSGDEYYESSEDTTTFNVLKIKPTIDLISVSSTSENITFGDLVDVSYHINDGVIGTVSVYVDSILSNTVNIGDSISLDGLNAGYHNIKLVYNGDANYTSCENNLTFEVLKKKIDISAAVKIIDMVYGKTQISFTTSFDGVLNINASNKYFKSFNVSADNNYLNLSDIDADDYNIEYVFVPNNQNYDSAITTSTLTIFKAEPTFDIVIGDFNYKESTNLNINYLNDVAGIANITISNSEGFEVKYLNVVLSGTNFNRALNNLNASKYTVTLEYCGNNNYYSSTQLKTFNVFKIDPIILVDVANATYSQTAKITANSNAEGNITITIGTVKTYNELLITDKRVSQNVNDIDAGTYDVAVTYNGNTNYNIKTVNTKLTIYKVSTTVIATADDITYSQTVVVNVKASVDGEVTVKIDNTYINNTNVIANAVTPITFDNVPAGSHNISVVLTPSNKNYNESSFSDGFTVSKKQTSITLGVENSVYGEEVIINVTASEDGKITLKVGDITRERNVLANTMAKINFGVLAADSYNIEATFNAGENYKPSNKQTTLVVSPAKVEITAIQAQNNTYGENTIINVKTNVAGVLTVKLNNANAQTFNIDVNKLTALDLGKYDVNNYDIDLSLDAGSNYTKATGNTKVTVNPKQTTVELNFNNNVYGKNVIVNVTASENGKVTVNVGNNVRIVNVEANKVLSIDFGILDAKSYEVNATFDGGKNYQICFDKDSLVVSPKSTTVTLIDSVNSYTYSENVIIKVKSDTDGTLTVKVGDTPQTKQVTAGNVVTFDFGIFNVDNYGMTINLTAGNNYVPYQNTTSIAITPKITSIAINAKDYDTTEKVIVNVTTTENGKVSIKLGSITKTIDINANVLTSVDFGILDIGSYNIDANFTAGNNYIDSSATGNVKVLSKIKDEDVNINIPEIKANQENNIVINLPSDATGTITLIIGNDNYTFDVINGVANVKVPELVEGNYNFTITYSGDNKYVSFSKTNGISVTKIIPTTIISSAITTVYNGGKYLVATLKDINGKPMVGVQVSINLNGFKYLTTDKNGQVKLSTNGLAPNTYTAIITFAGNNNYAKSSATAKVTVKKATPKLTANKKTFKKSVKTKKYTVTLKDNVGKALKNTKVTIKVNKKTYTAKTNSKGVATFKITKLTKKGKYTATVTYKGSSYYNKLTKKVKIIIK